MTNKILLSLIIIAAADTAKEWLLRPWDYLAHTAASLRRGPKRRRGDG